METSKKSKIHFLITLLFIFILTTVGCSSPTHVDPVSSPQTKIPPPNEPLTKEFTETPKQKDANPTGSLTQKNSSEASNVTKMGTSTSSQSNPASLITPFKIVYLTLIVAFFAIIPMILDICLAHNKLTEVIKKLSSDELIKNLSSSKPLQLPVIHGLARSMIAFTIILIISIIVFILIGNNRQDGLISNTLTAFTTTLTAITAYYFGSRAMEKPQDVKESVSPKSAKVITVSPPLEITARSATLLGIVNANGSRTEVFFQYGTTRDLYTNESAREIKTGSIDTGVSRKVEDLLPNTIYYYRIVAQNIAGTVYGIEKEFRTQNT